MGYCVRLKGNWPGNFRRSVRQDPETGQQVLDGGEVVEVLEFSPGVAVVLSEAEYRAISRDIGVAIVNVAIDANGREREVEEPFEVEVLDEEPAGDDGQPAWLDVPRPVLEALSAAGISDRETLVAFMAENNLTGLHGIGKATEKQIRTALGE